MHIFNIVLALIILVFWISFKRKKIVEWPNGDFSVKRWFFGFKQYIDLTISSNDWHGSTHCDFNRCIGTKEAAEDKLMLFMRPKPTEPGPIEYFFVKIKIKWDELIKDEEDNG